jgi:hypothetical protein
MQFNFTDFLTAIFGNASAAQIIMWLVGVGFLIYFLVKLFPVFRRFVHTMDALGDLPGALEKLDHIQDELKVLAELRPNHGGSIRDHITKIAKQTDSTQKALKEHIDLCKLAEAKGLIPDADN